MARNPGNLTRTMKEKILETKLMKRSHTCGALRKSDTGSEVILTGWVASQRDHGGLIFIDLRDRWGITQIVVNPDMAQNIVETAKYLRMETVIAVRGNVVVRPEKMINKDLATGEIEIEATELQILNEAKPVPMTIKDPCEAMDETRLKYRYLDLRRPSMQKNLIIRHRTAQSVRRFFDSQGFLEIETPFLMKSTPEGARDYLVPSRIHKGKFYALPQSPQQYKQLLMVSGYDRYFQIVKCFRDEDLRADRQPEFTQIDVEMSFVDEDDIIGIMEGLMVQIFHEILNVDLQAPFPRMNYAACMAQYGNDRPDLRFGLAIQELNETVADTDFRVFKEILEGRGSIRGMCLKGKGPFSRKQVDDLTESAKLSGARGLVVIQVTDAGVQSSISKFLSQEQMNRIVKRFEAMPGDVILIVADTEPICCQTLGNLRLKLGKMFELYHPRSFVPLWVLDFPLLEWNKEENRFVAMHHPFTSPRSEDIMLLDSDPGKVRARAYDLVLNGSEIAGGSIRIHQSSMQAKIFSLLGIDEPTAQRKFGFLIEALDYGAPPHGGIAFGFDRLVMMLAGEESIREVIAFPKTTSAMSLMDNCPSEVDEQQLEELGLRLNIES
jgi:aspartyl-tRNA synthetase